MRDDKIQRAMPVLSALGKSVCYLALFLGMQVAVMLPPSVLMGIQAALGGNTDALYDELLANSMTYSMISGLLTLVVILAVYRFRRKPMGEALWLRRVDGPTLWTGASLAPALYLIVGTVLMLLPEAWTESYNEASAGIDTGTLTGVLAVAVVAPVVEELIFRGLVLNRLSRAMPGWLAVALSAAVFGACHGHPVWFGYAFVLGAVFGFVALRTGSILPTILGHLVFNGIGQIFSVIPETEEGTELLIAIGMLLLAAILLPILDRKGVGALFKPAPKAAPAEELPTAPGTYEFDPWDE